MTTSLQLVFLYLGTSSLRNFVPAARIFELLHDFAISGAPVLVAASSSNFVGRPRSTVRTMTTLPNGLDGVSIEVGQSDIGNENEGDDMNFDIDASQVTSWRSLLETSNKRSRKIRGSNFVQLATVDQQSNEPRCRTIVFRGFLNLPDGHKFWTRCSDLSCAMKMCTDRRSEKVGQAMASHMGNNAELLWWFPKTSEQYRIRGELIFVGGGEFALDDDRSLSVARKELWGSLSDDARESFLKTHRPGTVYVEESTDVVTSDRQPGGRNLLGNIVPPPDAFLLMLLIPKRCDYLRLTNMYRQVDELFDRGWQSQRVNP